MAWVILKANWFVEGRRIRRGDPPSQPVEIPDELLNVLPKSATVVGGPEPGAPAISGPKTLSELQQSQSKRTTLLQHLNRSRPGFGPGPVASPDATTEPKDTYQEPEGAYPEPEPAPEEDPLAKAKAAAKRKPKK